MVKVSIIIPTYNVEKYLRECLDSVINQSLKDIEIICINDGSTDNSLAILEEYAKKDDRIIVINKKNEGVAKTRNLGISRAKGQYVCFMDPDDFYPTIDILEILYNKAFNNKALICGGEFSRFKDDYAISQNFTETLDGYIFNKEGFINYNDYQFDYGYHRFIYKKDFLIKNNIIFPNYRRFQDPPFFCKAMIEAKQFYAIKKNTYAYRIGHQQIKWDTERVNALLNGILDNVQLASKYNLNRLKKYTIIRLEEHKDALIDNLNWISYILLFKLFLLDYRILFSVKKIILNKIFSITNTQDKKHKLITIFAIKIKIRKNT